MKTFVAAAAVGLLCCVVVSSALAQGAGVNQATPPNSQPWWPGPVAGIIGGIGGSVIGLMGAAIGTLTGTGRARKTVFTLLNVMGVIGAISLTTGVVAIILGQPYAVWYPLVLCGVITLPMSLFMRGTIRKRFEAVELSRMQAMDVRPTP